MTVTGAARNIARHYDLSNDLFAIFLDESMTYSAALFTDGTRRSNRPRLTRSSDCLMRPASDEALACSKSEPDGVSWLCGPPGGEHG